MKKKKKLRRLNFLMYKHSKVWFINEEKVIEQYKLMENNRETYPKHVQKDIEERYEIYVLSKELELSEKEREEMWWKLSRQKNLIQESMKKRPTPEGRDNKGVYVGRGGSDGNKIRYPSKKRSKKTWKKFYEMFPWAAERDGWDGETSKRFKND